MLSIFNHFLTFRTIINPAKTNGGTDFLKLSYYNCQIFSKVFLLYCRLFVIAMVSYIVPRFSRIMSSKSSRFSWSRLFRRNSSAKESSQHARTSQLPARSNFLDPIVYRQNTTTFHVLCSACVCFFYTCITARRPSI